MSERYWLFSYGTLRLPEVQRSIFGRLLKGVPDRLPGFALDRVPITDPEVVALSGSEEHPVVRPSADPADEVSGTVLEIEEDDLERADAYETDDYRRVLVTLRSGRKAFLYVERFGNEIWPE